MNKSLRDEVAELRDANQGSWLGEHLRQMLDRHPPADGVVVPRELLINLRNLSDALDPSGDDARIGSIIEQADTILAEGKA